MILFLYRVPDMKNFFLALTSILGLSACATVIDHQTQDITMRTPGATNARCVIENEDMKYHAYTDETIEIMKSPHDLVIRCMAPGNREQTVHLKREINEWVFANVVNGFVPGAGYDYFSRGAFKYPDEFVVSFVGAPIKENELPSYHNKDLKHNNDYGHPEYMGPRTIIGNEDRNYEQRELKKKEGQYGGSSDFDNANSSANSDLDAIHRQYNPGVSSSYDPAEEDK